MWVVTKGLQPGEKLIVDGLQKVHANAPVSPKMVTVDIETGAIQQPPQTKGGLRCSVSFLLTGLSLPLLSPF